jgi:hypothetical protein
MEEIIFFNWTEMTEETISNVLRGHQFNFCLSYEIWYHQSLVLSGSFHNWESASGIWHHSPVLEHFGTELGHLILVPLWFWHGHLFSVR